MSTVKIKTEPTATVDVQVKLEANLPTADFKLEQHTSDIDTKVEPDSDTDIKSDNDDGDDGDTDQSQVSTTSSNQRRVICKHPGCNSSFKYTNSLAAHKHEHMLQTELIIQGKAYILARQSLNDQWPCPFPSCTATVKLVGSVRDHIRKYHGNTMERQHHQQLPAQMAQRNLYFLDVDNFYVTGVRCGYHNTTGVFICYECRQVPECLLTHLQQTHGFDKKSIDSSALPESAVNASADPSINQHTSNPHLAAAISQPYQQLHQYIVQGWLCVISDCGCCGYTVGHKSAHKKKMHRSEQFSTVPALVLRLFYKKTQTSCFLITGLGQASGAVTTNSNRVKRHRLDYSQDELNALNENGDDISQNETTDTSNQKRQWKCDYDDCGRLFKTSEQLSKHRREHKLEVVINVHGNTYFLSRQSSDDRWPCPIPDCEATWKAICTTRSHIQNMHSTFMEQKRANMEDDNTQQQSIIKKRQLIIRYLKMDDFYVSGTRCGYHTTTGVFMRYRCRLVPECLLTHLQQKHGYDEKSIDNVFLPDSAKISGNADPNINQHTRNSHIASAISHSSQLHHRDIARGWFCVKPNCNYCCSTQGSKNQHHCTEHRGEQQSMVPAVVLRLHYAKTQTTCFLITRLDTVASNVNSNNPVNQYNGECDDDDDELVLSDYSDDDDTQ